jgi:hypothetical protein
MAGSNNLQQASSISDRDLSFDLLSINISGSPSYSAAPVKPVVSEFHYDFLSFLAVAQELETDILPITWHPELDEVGRGGTAKISQSLINLHMSFAFKRLKWPILPQSKESKRSESKNFLALISEIFILCHPSIRGHPNIIQLEGICWDFPPINENIPSEKQNVWPVLVFEKMKHRDLDRFLNSDTGRTLCLEDRLELCEDVAFAVATMHACRKQLCSLLHLIGGPMLTRIQVLFIEISSLKMC